MHFLSGGNNVQPFDSFIHLRRKTLILVCLLLFLSSPDFCSQILKGHCEPGIIAENKAVGKFMLFLKKKQLNNISFELPFIKKVAGWAF